MKKLPFITILYILFLVSCAPYMYGVPQETWDRMSEPERLRAMDLYEREQQARRLEAEDRARRQAYEQARQEELRRSRQHRIEAIHRGEGAHGELLRIRLHGGKIRIGDQYHRFESIAFSIADGETREIIVVDNKGRTLALNITYDKGVLFVDGVRFPYDRSWERGRLYANTSTSGMPALLGVDLSVETHNRSSRHERSQPRLNLIREEPQTAQVRPPEPHKQQVVQQPAPRPAPPAADRPPHSLEIVILSGELKEQGQNPRLERATLRLAEGESRTLPLRAGKKTIYLAIQYRNGELFIDGTRDKGRDQMRLFFEKEWKTGKTYRFDLKGRMHLEKLELKVTGIETR